MQLITGTTQFRMVWGFLTGQRGHHLQPTALCELAWLGKTARLWQEWCHHGSDSHVQNRPRCCFSALPGPLDFLHPNSGVFLSAGDCPVCISFTKCAWTSGWPPARSARSAGWTLKHSSARTAEKTSWTHHFPYQVVWP